MRRKRTISVYDTAGSVSEIDIQIFGEQLGKYRFLKAHIERLPDVDAARERYARMTRGDVRQMCDDLLSIL